MFQSHGLNFDICGFAENIFSAFMENFNGVTKTYLDQVKTINKNSNSNADTTQGGSFVEEDMKFPFQNFGKLGQPVQVTSQSQPAVSTPTPQATAAM